MAIKRWLLLWFENFLAPGGGLQTSSDYFITIFYMLIFRQLTTSDTKESAKYYWERHFCPWVWHLRTKSSKLQEGFADWLTDHSFSPRILQPRFCKLSHRQAEQNPQQRATVTRTISWMSENLNMLSSLIWSFSSTSCCSNSTTSRTSCTLHCAVMTTGPITTWEHLSTRK